MISPANRYPLSRITRFFAAPFDRHEPVRQMNGAKKRQPQFAEPIA
jgi:hypothetical protein